MTGSALRAGTSSGYDDYEKINFLIYKGGVWGGKGAGAPPDPSKIEASGFVFKVFFGFYGFMLA